MLFGRVTEEVVRKAPTPVVTLRADADVALYQNVERILAPVDSSDTSDAAAQHAKESTRPYGADMDLLREVTAPFYPPPMG